MWMATSCSGPPGRAHLGPNNVCICFNAGSSLQSGQFNEDMIPTVGFNMRKITKGNVTIKVRAAACGGPLLLGRATEAPGKCQPQLGEGRVGSCCWRTGKWELTGERGKPGAGKETAEGKRLGTQWLSLACLFLSPHSPHPLLTQLWDIGGQPRFRSMWERYCRGVSAIV